MTHLRYTVVTIAAVLLVAATAAAKEEWKTVTLRGEPGLTISIPSVAIDQGGGKHPDDLMFIAVMVPLHGGLVCLASRTDYPKDTHQAAFAAALATERREVFCNQDKATISGLNIGGSKSFKHNGMQAAVCTASYTDSAEKAPGRVTSQMVIAAPAKIYMLDCTVEDEDQDTVEFEWSMTWADKVKRIQDSFHLPE
jgi:hypothetical protein